MNDVLIVWVIIIFIIRDVSLSLFVLCFYMSESSSIEKLRIKLITFVKIAIPTEISLAIIVYTKLTLV
jgi:hypothetical protein